MVLASVEDVSEVYYVWDDLMAEVFAYAEECRAALFPVGVSLSTLTGQVPNA